MELKSCPFCGSNDFRDYYVYIKCNNCGALGPEMNGGINDDHADYIDHENAMDAWNKRDDKYEKQYAILKQRFYNLVEQTKDVKNGIEKLYKEMFKQ